MSKYNLLAIDPSIRALGWSVFEVDESAGAARLLRSGVQRTRGGREEVDWVERLDMMVDFVIGLCLERGKECSVVVIELPSVYAGGRGDAASASGSIMKLSSLVFALRQALLGEGIEVQLVPVRKWKGTLPKHITERRVRIYWHWKGSDHNESDAVGIGDYWIRKELRYKSPYRRGK
jgi:hypothetical protein